MDAEKYYIFIMPDGLRIPMAVRESQLGRNSVRHKIQTVAADAVRKAGLKTSWKNPQPIEVKVLEQRIVEGVLKEEVKKSVSVTPPVECMTQSEYNEESKKIVENLPAPMQAFVLSWAWEYGHASGFEEVISIARELTDQLAVALSQMEQT